MTILANQSAASDIIDVIPSGMMAVWATATAPTGWLLCAGQAVNRTTYANLFTAISTTYGSGDGSTTFNLPDLRGRVVVGEHLMNGSEPSPVRLTDNNNRGQSAGLDVVSLTIAEMPSHNHGGVSGGMSANASHSHTWLYDTVYVNIGASGYGFNTLGYATGSGFGSSSTDLSHTHNIANTGGGASHTNKQPYIALNQIIKT